MRGIAWQDDVYGRTVMPKAASNRQPERPALAESTETSRAIAPEVRPGSGVAELRSRSLRHGPKAPSPRARSPQPRPRCDLPPSLPRHKSSAACQPAALSICLLARQWLPELHGKANSLSVRTRGGIGTSAFGGANSLSPAGSPFLTRSGGVPGLPRSSGGPMAAGGGPGPVLEAPLAPWAASGAVRTSGAGALVAPVRGSAGSVGPRSRQ